MTGESFRALDRGRQVKDLKERISHLRNICGDMLNVNNVRENGFDGAKYDRISKQIEWLEYILWGLTEK